MRVRCIGATSWRDRGDFGYKQRLLAGTAIAACLAVIPPISSVKADVFDVANGVVVTVDGGATDGGTNNNANAGGNHNSIQAFDTTATTNEMAGSNGVGKSITGSGLVPGRVETFFVPQITASNRA